ncbi:alpha/beta fold hydrolase [Paeniglutamicibacter psychrophenolicus]|uniref:alpha/beta fold hydrolase n=1 Tax=Paeniglutamicibacter psychrophenolicus TaxID=257454 RepID=UPI0027857DCD|nr:alpha/beta hydrolase [Paeniglutamicibacter psychrophenolicus]MDQ0092955.1 3-oxoadipate enol-lactonase [Paeniglutamicibacter psychrophenolicus]
MSIPALTPSLLHQAADLPTLVLGPSLGTGSLALWGPAVPYLRERFQLVAWDLPGHGESAPSTGDFSMAELASGVIKMLEALETDGVIVPGTPLFYTGVSVGGAIALQLANDFPGTFAGLSVICSAAKIGTPEGWRERAELVAKAGTPVVVTGSAERWFAPGFIEANPVISTDLLHNLQDADRFAYAHVCRALAGFDLREALPGMKDPILAIAGAHDVVCPPADAQFIAEHAPNARAATIDTVAHLAPAEDPEATSVLLVEFFASATAEKTA